MDLTKIKTEWLMCLHRNTRMQRANASHLRSLPEHENATVHAMERFALDAASVMNLARDMGLSINITSPQEMIAFADTITAECDARKVSYLFVPGFMSQTVTTTEGTYEKGFERCFSDLDIMRLRDSCDAPPCEEGVVVPCQDQIDTRNTHVLVTTDGRVLAVHRVA